MMPTRITVKTIALLSAILLCWAVMGSTLYAVRRERADRQLIAAIKANDARAVCTLLDQGADPNTPGDKIDSWTTWLHHFAPSKVPERYTPSALFVALGGRVMTHGYGQMNVDLQRDPAIAQALIEHGANIHARTDAGETPLMAAARLPNSATLKLLLARGASVQDADANGQTALFNWAVPLENLQLLVDHGADVNGKDIGGGRPIMEAAQYKDDSRLRFMIAHHAQINVADNSGYTPLMRAAFANHRQNVLYLLQNGAKVGAQNKHGETALTLAKHYNRTEIIRLLTRTGL